MVEMTSGSPMKSILRFSIPLIIGTVFQQLYGMVDTVIVGRFVGVNALAGIGSTGSFNYLIITSCTGICSGFAVPVAQQFGAKDEVRLRRYVAGAIRLSTILAAVITVVVVAMTGTVLRWMNTPEDIFDYAYQYIRIIFMGIPAVFLYNLSASIIRALGDSKTPLLFLILCSGLNILLDIVFILFLDMGVSGAAVATVIAQLTSGLCCLFYIKRKYPILRLKRGDWEWNPRYAANLCTMGIPMGLQFSIVAIGCLIMQASVNALGSAAVASVTAGDKIHALLGCPLETMGVAVATYSGQNTGAGKIDRLTKGIKAVGVFVCIYSAIALGIQLLLGRPMLLLFLDPGEELIIRQARNYLICMALTYIPLGYVTSLRSMIQGMGFVSFAMWSGVFETIARVIVSLILIPLFGFGAVCLSHPGAWVLADVFLIPAFIGCIKVMKKRMGMIG
ncbi:MAG: MATE family efflux transporter [Lachnospiraceae bacterium]|nr:MATE family efflux transporter [Lachnospiraceae bacterium]